MGKVALFSLKVLIPAYVIGTVLLFVIGLTDFFLGVLHGNYRSEKHDISFGRRMVTILAWPALIFTVKGRKMLHNLWRNIIV